MASPGLKKRGRVTSSRQKQQLSRTAPSHGGQLRLLNYESLRTAPGKLRTVLYTFRHSASGGFRNFLYKTEEILSFCMLIYTTYYWIISVDRNRKVRLKVFSDQGILRDSNNLYSLYINMSL